MTDAEKKITTGEFIGQYRRDLIGNGVPQDVADLIIREAARSLVEHGPLVTSAEPVTA